MRNTWRTWLVVGVLAIAVYAGLSAFADVRKVAASLARFPWSHFLFACLLALGNYAIRFVRWEYYLRGLGCRVPLRASATVFLSGLVMAISPAKVGELLKAYLLRSCCGVSVRNTAPVVVAERLTDLIAVVALAAVGLGLLPGGWPVLVGGLGLVAAVLGVVAWPRLALGIFHRLERIPRLGGLASRLEEAYASMRTLSTPGRLAVAVALGVAAWLCEAVAFHLVLGGLPDARPELSTSIFIYSFSTLAGALSFLPGGLGVTEGGLVGLSVLLVPGVDRTAGVVASVVVRLATLWLAVAVGAAASGLFVWWYGRAAGPEVEQGREGGSLESGPSDGPAGGEVARAEE